MVTKETSFKNLFIPILLELGGPLQRGRGLNTRACTHTHTYSHPIMLATPEVAADQGLLAPRPPLVVMLGITPRSRLALRQKLGSPLGREGPGASSVCFLAGSQAQLHQQLVERSPTGHFPAWGAGSAPRCLPCSQWELSAPHVFDNQGWRRGV